jgi:hypothetical protein
LGVCVIVLYTVYFSEHERIWALQKQVYLGTRDRCLLEDYVDDEADDGMQAAV